MGTGRSDASVGRSAFGPQCIGDRDASSRGASVCIVRCARRRTHLITHGRSSRPRKASSASRPSMTLTFVRRSSSSSLSSSRKRCNDVASSGGGGKVGGGTRYVPILRRSSTGHRGGETTTNESHPVINNDMTSAMAYVDVAVDGFGRRGMFFDRAPLVLRPHRCYPRINVCAIAMTMSRMLPPSYYHRRDIWFIAISVGINIRVKSICS